MKSSHESDLDSSPAGGPNFRVRIGESGLGYIQRQLLDVLKTFDPWCYSVRQLAIYVFWPRWFDHDSPIRRSTSRALKRLVERGLIFERGPEPFYAASPGTWITVEEYEAAHINNEFDEFAASTARIIAHCEARREALGFA